MAYTRGGRDDYRDRGRDRGSDRRDEGRDGGRAHGRNPDELGALWEKKGRKGVFLSGFIEIDGQRIDVVCFEVESQNPKAPAWRVLKSKPRDDREDDERGGGRGHDARGYDDEEPPI